MEVTLGMATIPERFKTLEIVLDSLCKQVDKIYLTLNGFYIEGEPWYPTFLDKYENLEYFWADNRLADAEKFHYVDKATGYYISWDDDLIANEQSVKKLIERVDKYNGVVGFHGRNYPIPVQDFRRWASNYRCLSTVSEDVKVNFLGSGCACFHTDRLKLSYNGFLLPNMADCYFSREIYTQGIPMIVLRHFQGEIGYTHPTETIWRKTHDFTEQTKILQSFLK